MELDTGLQVETLQDRRLDDQVVHRAKPHIDQILALGGGRGPGGVNIHPHAVLDQDDPGPLDLERGERVQVECDGPFPMAELTPLLEMLVTVSDAGLLSDPMTMPPRKLLAAFVRRRFPPGALRATFADDESMIRPLIVTFWLE